MEIERKYLVKQLPENLGKYPHFVIEQGWNSAPFLIHPHCFQSVNHSDPPKK